MACKMHKIAHKKYYTWFWHLEKYGGGVAILIKEGIDFLQDFSFEHLFFYCELLCIKLNLGKSNEISVNYILCEDIYARTKQIGCFGENENGSFLEKIINEVTDFSVLNSQDMTSDHFPIEASFSIDYQRHQKHELQHHHLPLPHIYVPEPIKN
ncbi:hypothetical protein BpHYR1_050893 [Brachionus plicatilis]|uniref:RNA-directed DNA polymerase from mobile element jockey-like n=1 Tax=Brachionus plicatilis TaxID=10195 RepID=A0A3M7RDU2_BRAPC|nr:hypothetical protein BpHYR1_050893 [Brachionus plicatilis]